MKRVPSGVVFAVLVAGLGVIVSASAPSPAPASPADKYDDYFRKYSKRFFGDRFDWRLFKAQGIVESNLRPNVVSGSGAHGVMQLMAGTYAEARRRNREFGDIANPEWNIAAGIWYAHEEWDYWDEGADGKFHRQFTLGSYNAGRSPLVRAQKLALAEKLNHRRWPTIEKVAPRVPNWRYRETLAYVNAVFVNLSSMDRGGRVKGPTISKDNGDGSALPDKLKRFLGVFKHFKFWDDD
jgi:membrane-bound lytic murein transglycosylase F